MFDNHAIRFVIISLVISFGITTVLPLFGEIQEAEAMKGEGVLTKKFGSATAGIVCGVKLCSDIPNFDEQKRTPNYPSSPLLQYYFGVSLDRIICNDGYQIVLKSTNFYPACVKLSSVDQLIKIGWAVSQTEKADLIKLSEIGDLDIIARKI